jgi:hypothetical protein
MNIERNEKVKELIETMTKVLNNKDKIVDMYLYVGSILIDANYDKLEKQYLNQEDDVLFFRDTIKLLMLRGLKCNSLKFILNNTQYDIVQLIKDKFTVEDEEGWVDAVTIFNSLWGYFKVNRFLFDFPFIC